MEISSKNNIERLYKLIFNLQKESTSNSNLAFCNVFNIDRNDTSEIILAYSDLIKLCIDSNNLIDKYFPNNLVLKDHINNTISALSEISFNSNFGMESFRSNLKDTTLTGLQMLSIMIPADEKVLSSKELSEILENINSIIIDIENSNMHDDLKNILIDRINDILIIIEKYEVSGTTKLIKSIETSIGSICLNMPNIQNETEVNLCKNIIKKLTGTISFFNESVTLLENISKFIP